MNNDGEGLSVQVPQNVEDVELLVKRLYSPGSPNLISQIDTKLKQLQLSPEGWQLADALLQSQDQNVRFFGALTFQVKLNNDGSRLETGAAQTVLMRLISWTIQLDGAGEGHLVRKKLCASLATFFVRSSIKWRRPLLHLAASFQRGQAVPLGQISATENVLRPLLPALSEQQLVVLLWLSANLATDVGKIDSTSSAHAEIHGSMESIVEDASSIMQHALSRPASLNSPEIKVQSLTCFLSWVNYAQPMWPSKPDALTHLRQLTIGLASLLTDEATQNEAMDVFRDILEGYTTFFQPQHMQVLANIIYEHARPRLLEGLRNAEVEVLPVAQFVIAYGIANIQQVVEDIDDEIGSTAIVQMHLSILQTPGYPGEEDEVSIQSVEFWNTFIEYINDVMFSRTSDHGGPPRWSDQARAVCTDLASLLWSKMRTPPTEVAKTWSDADSEAFREFRMDASDLLLSVYLFLGKDLARRFVALATDSLLAKNWLDVEAALFCINTLGDNISEDPDAEVALEQMFASSLFRDIADFDQPIPPQTRRTAIDTLGAYGQYIGRHEEFLPDTLRFLFASLENPGLSTTAARSISALCSTCRNSLTGELDGFLQQYGRFAASETSDTYTNEKVMGAIGAIIQAVSPQSAQARPLSVLLDHIDRMVSSASQLAIAGHLETSQEVGICALTCLASIGKGLQVPDEVPINLYDDESKSSDQSSYWTSPEGQALQLRIVNICYTVLQTLPDSGEAVEESCQVLRSGFTEIEPGAFVFPPDTAVVFLEKCALSTPSLETALSMVSTLIKQHSRQSSPAIDEQVYRIYRKVAFFIRTLKDPNQDPHIAQSCIDVLNSMVSRYSNVLLDLASPTGETVAPVFDFAIKAIECADPLPKRTSASFWSNFIKPSNPPVDESVRLRSGQAMAAYGPLLSKALIHQIIGQGQRSELDQLCEPLRALILTQTRTKTWIETALLGGDVPSVNASVDDAEKRKFVQSLFMARGDVRKTKEIVKTFYAACRGTVPSYR